LSYDNNGNLLSIGSTTYAWDYANRLLSVGSSTYAYDAFSNRIQKTVGTTTTVYPNTLYSQSGNVITRNIFDSSGALVATVNGGTSTSTVYIHPDILGSTNVITNASGQFLEALNYRPFGSTNLDLGTTGNEGRGYIGQIADPESSLLYLNARYMNPQQGQFLSEDPVNISLQSSALLTDPQNLNFYAYANDNPITGKDPNGKLVEEISRPINSYPVLSDFNHSFLYVVPSAGENLPGVSSGGENYNTSQPFTLGGYPVNNFKALQLGVDESEDYGIATNQEDVPGVSRTIIAPPAGMTSAQYDAAVVNSYNSLSPTQGGYNLLGIKAVWPGANSNNAATTLLLNSGISQPQMNSNVNTLRTASGDEAPGLGMNISSPQTFYNALSGALRALSSIVAHGI
jgi:RHS repeat-associated protein